MDIVLSFQTGDISIFFKNIVVNIYFKIYIKSLVYIFQTVLHNVRGHGSCDILLIVMKPNNKKIVQMNLV